MATLYYNAAVDGDWNTLGNWWTNAGHTIQATALPTSSDSVVLSASVQSNSGSAPTVVNLTLTGSGHYIFPGVEITVTGIATFGGEVIVAGTITGNATFNDSATTFGMGSVVGHATFNDTTYNTGTITGSATFNDNSYNDGVIAGSATFNDNSYNEGNITGNATFSPSAAAVQISGFYQGVYGSVSFAFEKGVNGSSILGIV